MSVPTIPMIAMLKLSAIIPRDHTAAGVKTVTRETDEIAQVKFRYQINRLLNVNKF